MSETIRFIEKYADSSQFKQLFEEGMNLVEETANYLDGEGRSDSRVLARIASLNYATESMRLTTRLMQIASWLLLQRAVNEGELTFEEARSEKHKVRLRDHRPADPESEDFLEMPDRLQDLVNRSFQLNERVLNVDRMIRNSTQFRTESGINRVQGEINRIAEAFNASQSS
jgi:regulator of CtrA degradation